MSRRLLMISLHPSIFVLSHKQNKQHHTMTCHFSTDEKFVDALKRNIQIYLKDNFLTRELEDLGVLVTENVLFSTHERRKVYNIILSYFQFRFLEFVPNPLVYCFGTKSPDAILIDVSRDCIVATPICQYRILDENICISTRSIDDIRINNDDDRVKLYNYIFGTKDEEEYEQNDLSICLMVNHLKRRLPIDIRKTLTENIVINGYYSEELFEYSKIVNPSFKVKTLNLDLLCSCIRMYSDHFLKHRYANGDNFHERKSTIQHFSGALDSIDWYQLNYS